MPSYLRASFNDWCVLWRRTGTHSSGLPVVSAIAEEHEVEWDPTAREDTAPDGSAVAISATVRGLPDDVPVGSAVWKGRIRDLAGTAQLPLRNVMRIATFGAKPEWRGRDFETEAGLERAADALAYRGDAGTML